MVVIDSALLTAPVPKKMKGSALADEDPGLDSFSHAASTHGIVATLRERWQCSAGKTLILAGRGALGAASSLQRLAEHYRIPVATTSSARGVIPEDHPLSLAWDLVPAAKINPFLAQCDQVLALGVKFSHNSSKGFELEIPPDKLLHIDASADVLEANYRAGFAAVADVPAVVHQLAADLPAGDAAELNGRWDGLQLDRWRREWAHQMPASHTPRVGGIWPPSPCEFFHELREGLPRDALLVLDSGLHQSLARAYFPVFTPGGLLFPAGLQSMGFALPAAIGALLADPHRRVVALLGDGGLQMGGMDLTSAVEQQLPLTTIVWDDGHFGLIRVQQLDYDGSQNAVRLPAIDYRRWMESLRVTYSDASHGFSRTLSEALHSDRPNLLHVRVDETFLTRASRYRASLRGWWQRWTV
jgi:acetolactate synthase-1/2/3 large subunit